MATTVGVLLILILRYPEIGLISILVTTSSIIFENKLPLIPIGIGSFHVPDVILLGLLLLVGVRLLAEKNFNIVLSPLNTPIILFFLAMVFATLYGIFQGTVDFQSGFRSIRVITYYLTFFVVINLVREKEQVTRLCMGLSMLGVVIALAMLAQAVVGQKFEFLPGRVEELANQEPSASGVTRILPPGQSIILSMVIVQSILVVAIGHSLKKWQTITLWFILAAALLVTFTRTFWLQLLFGMGVTFYFLKREEKNKMIRYSLGLLLLGILFGLYLITFPSLSISKVWRASLLRFNTLFSTATFEESSLQWRKIENEYGIEQVYTHPLWGLGLGARYRPFDPRLDDLSSEWDARKYMHNAHLWMLVQGGLVCYLLFLWLSYSYVKNSLKEIPSVRDPFLRTYYLGFVITFISCFLGAFFSPMFFQWYWTPFFGIMMGVCEAIRINRY